MITENTPELAAEAAPEFEVKNAAAVLSKNRALLAELAETKAALLTAQEGLKAAQASATDWQAKWHKATVLDVLDAELKAVSAGPIKYMRDVVTELGLLKMKADGAGIERVVWLDEKGGPADLSNGLYRHLCGVSERGGKDHELGRVLRASGASGSGSMGSSGHVVSQNTTPVPTPVTPMPLGLR